MNSYEPCDNGFLEIVANHCALVDVANKLLFKGKLNK